MSEPDKKLKARGGDMGDDTDAFLAWLDSLPKEPNDTVKAAYAAYKATVKPAPDLAELAELVEAAPDADVALMLELIAAGQALASKAAGVTLGDEARDLIPLVNKWCTALAKIKEPQT